MVYTEWLPRSEAQALKEKHIITLVHGLIKARKVLDMLENVEDKKEWQAKLREEAPKKKEDAQEAFLKCKS